MPRSFAAGTAAALVFATLVVLTGCQRAPEEPAATPAPHAAAPSPTEVTPPGGSPTVATPASDEPLLAYVWHCDDGQARRMRNLLREDAITIEMHEGGRKLPRVVSASGAKYSDGSLTFWTRGDTATLERAGSPPVNCRQDR
jgi:membrane-bound inhibitor of C-type lysozyme